MLSTCLKRINNLIYLSLEKNYQFYLDFNKLLKKTDIFKELRTILKIKACSTFNSSNVNVLLGQILSLFFSGCFPKNKTYESKKTIRSFFFQNMTIS